MPVGDLEDLGCLRRRQAEDVAEHRDGPELRRQRLQRSLDRLPARALLAAVDAARRAR